MLNLVCVQVFGKSLKTEINNKKVGQHSSDTVYEYIARMFLAIALSQHTD